MSLMEASNKWKERSGAPSANGTKNRVNTSTAFFGPMNFRSLRKYQIKPASTTQFKTPADSHRSGYKESHTNPEKGTRRARQLFSQFGRTQRRHKTMPRVRMIFLPPINEHVKRSRNRFSLPLGIFFRWSWRSRTKIRGTQKKVMRLRIDIHRTGAKLGIQCFTFRELVGG